MKIYSVSPPTIEMVGYVVAIRFADSKYRIASGDENKLAHGFNRERD